MKRLQITFFILLSMCIMALVPGVPAQAAGPFTCSDTVRIMPTGDSLTQGYASGVNDVGDQIAYRKTLHDDLRAQGRQFDFVGSFSAGYNYAGFDADHSGVPGWNVQQIEVNIYDWLVANNPDIVLLHAGTNDVNVSFVNNYNRLLNNVDTYESNFNTEVTVVVALIINRVTSTGDPVRIARTNEFNAGLETLVNNRIANGDDLILIDMENDAGIIYDYESNGGNFYDLDAAGIHLGVSGYNKMAGLWESTLLGILPDCSSSTNNPPTANAGADQTVVDTDGNGSEFIFFNGSGSTDSDGTISSYSWSVNGTEIATGATPSYVFSVGTYTVTLTVTDNEGATDTDTVQITVQAAPNQAPNADAGSDITVTDSDNNGTENVTLNGSGSIDSDGTISTYEWQENGNPIGTGVSPTLPFSVGVHTVTLLVTDDDGASDSDIVQITVQAAPNQPPNANAGNDITVTDSDNNGIENVTLNGSGSSDSDGTVVSYEWQENGNPIGTGVNPTLPFSVGVHTVTLEVLDDDGATDTDTVIVTVQAGNGSGGSNRVTNGLLALYEFNENGGSTVADTSGSGSPLNLTISNTGNISWGAGTLTTTGSTIIQSSGPATKIIDSARTTNEITLEAWVQSNDLTQSGPARIAGISGNPSNRNITLGQGLWGSQPLDVYDVRLRTRSTTTNGIPSLSTPAGGATTNLAHVVYTHATNGVSTLYVNGVAVANGQFGTDLGNWDTSFPMVLANEPTGNRAWLGTFHLVAVYNRALGSAEVTQNYNAGADGGGSTANQPPTANAGADQTLTDADNSGSELVSLNGTGSSDSDGTIASYSWSENGSQIAIGATPQVTFAVGTHTVTLTVTDDDGATATDTVVITVNAPANVAPTANAGADQIVVDSDGGGDEQVTLDGSGSTDSDGTIASYSWSENGSQIATGATPQVAFAVGTHTVTLTVTDDDGATATDTVVIRVNEPANVAPTANAGADQTVVDNDSSGGEQVTLDGSGSTDSDGTIASYSWSENGSQIATGATPQVTFAVGAHTVTLTVTDDDGATATDTVVITVNAPGNQPPTANAGADQTVTDTDNNGNETVALNGSGSTDSDGTIASYSWQISGIEIATGVNPSIVLNVGTHTVTLVVTDDDGATANDYVVITVAANVANVAPTANAGADQTVTDSDNNGSETVTLNGSGSSDSDGTLVSYSWMESGSQIATGASPSVNLSVGTHNITLIVTDDDGATGFDTVVITVQAGSGSGGNGNRVSNGLLALYEFNETGGNTVADTSGAGSPMNLTISNAGNVTWGGGALRINSNTVVQSSGAATKIIDSVRTSNEITLEAWIQSDNLSQSGPARVAGISGNPSNRNITMGQGLWGSQPLDVYDLRLRTRSTTPNGTPSVSTPAGTVTTNLMHVVMTHAANGTSTIYVNGVAVANHNQGNDLGNWDTSFPFVLANEPTGDRPWLGTFHLVAVYNRALGSSEVAQNYNAGANGGGGSPTNQPPTANAGADQTVTDSDNNGTEPVTLNGTGSSDPENGALRYIWSTNGMTIPEGATVSADFPVGTTQVTLTVVDPVGAQDFDTVAITVNAPSNAAPTANAGADQTVTDADNNGSEAVTLNGSGSSDSDGSIVSYSWMESSSQIATGVSPSVNLAVGTHTITLVVTDDDGATASDDVVIIVNSPTNQAPTANAGADQTVTDGDNNGSEAVTLNGSGSSDPENGTLRYIWSATGMTIPEGQIVVANFPVGTTVVTLTVVDPVGAQSTDTVSITVNAGGSTSVVFPGTTWATRTPALVGLDETLVNQFISNVGGTGVIIKDGYLVASWGSGSNGDWASAVKPLWASMLFFAIEDGLSTGVNQPISDFGWALTPEDQSMTLNHLFNMVSGYARGEGPGQAFAYNDYGVSLYIKTLFDEIYNSNSGSASDVGNLVTNKLGSLQFEDGSLFVTSQGAPRLYMTPRDFARVGWWWLNKGNWNGTQLLPTSYFNTYMQPQVPGNLPLSTLDGTDYLGVGTIGGGSNQVSYGPGIYGYGWWYNDIVGTTGNLTWPDAPTDIIQASGRWNQQMMTLYPSQNMVVAARGNWGVWQPGNANASMNTNLALLAQAAGGTTTNQPPTANAGVDQIVIDADNSGSELVTLNGGGSSDSDGSIVSYSWMENSSQIATGSSPSLELAVGTHTITLVVTDDDGATASDDVVITVNAPANLVPTANAGADQTVTDTDNNGSETIALNGSGSSDSDGSIVSYSWNEGGSEIATGVSPTVNLGVGTHNITLIVTDDDGATAFDTVVITVNSAANQVPTANAGPDQTVEDTDNSGTQAVTLNGSASTDPENGLLRYIWTATGVTIPEGAVVSAEFPVGVTEVTLTVIDPEGAQGTDTVSITVNAGPGNVVPVANAGADQTITDSDNNGNEAVTLNGSGSSDSDGSIVSYSWNEGGRQIATGVSPTINLSVGTHNITLIVTDDDGATAFDTVVITVQAGSSGGSRVTNSLLALYAFNETSGNTVADTSGAGSPLNLTISNLGNVTWGSGTLRINSSTVVQSSGAATKLINGVKSTNEITLEAWIQSDNLNQSGPARVAGISGNPSNRNITLGQGLWGSQPLDLYDMRLRTRSTNPNGTPSLSSPAGSATTNLMHVVLTHEANGTSRIYINGVAVANHNQGSDMGNWDTSFPFVLANEPTGDRPWLGTFYLVAVYNRALSGAEVQQNYNAGANGS